jgi:hypothetical protein
MTDSHAEAVALVTRQEESRRADEVAHRDAAIAEAVTLIEHRNQQARDSAAWAASVKCKHAADIAAYDEAVLEYRQACDALTPVDDELQKWDKTVGASRAEKANAEKARARHILRPSDHDFPLTSELEAWQSEHAEKENRVRSIAARIITETRQYDDALHRKWELEALKEQARNKVLLLRNNP